MPKKYTESQARLVAYEIARADGVKAAALRRLREEYETFGTLSENGLNSIMARPGFAELVAREASRIAQAREEAATEAERDRQRREVTLQIQGGLRKDEGLLEEARKRLDEVLRNSEAVRPDLAVRAFAELARIIDKRRESSIPALATIQEGACLVRAISEVAREYVPSDRFPRFMKDLRERYSALSQQAEIKGETHA